MFQPAPPPKSPINIYRLLSPKASVRVSPLCFGAMSIGEDWAAFMGSVPKKAAFELLDKFYAQGGNFIDTASSYQEGNSERWLGEWMEQRKVRDQIVLATKFTHCYNNDPSVLRVNYGGNSVKALHVSVKDSLEKLRTNYIDILYLHWWDYTSGVEEMMRALDNLVKAGKVLYLGVSDTPAWVVSKANEYARHHGLSQFVVYQGLWNVAIRDLELEILPMCQSEGMALAIWSALGGGKFKTDEEIAAREKSGEVGRTTKGHPMLARTPNDIKATEVLAKVGKEIGLPVTSVALLYVLQKAPYVFPIVGGRTLDQLNANIEALKFSLTPQQMKELDNAVPLEKKFPYTMIGHASVENSMLGSMANYAWIEEKKAIVQHNKQ